MSENKESISTYKKMAEWVENSNKVLLTLIIFITLFILSYIGTLVLGALFNLGVPIVASNLVQMYILIIADASLLIMISVGLTMTTRIRKFGNFSHSEYIIIGVYAVISMKTIFNITASFTQIIFFQLIIAFIVSGLFGILGELIIFGPLIKRNATPLSLMVASIGYGIIIRQTVTEIFGATSRSISIVYPPEFTTQFGWLTELPVVGTFFSFFLKNNTTFNIGSIEVRVIQDHVWGLTIMLLSILALRYIFNNTTLGMAMRATSDDVDLAEISGINTKAVILWSWFLAAGVTGMGALFLLEAAEVNPTVGFARLLIIFAIVTLGGFDSFEGTLVSGFIIAGMRQLVIFANLQIASIGNEVDWVRNITFWSTEGDWSNVAPFFTIIVVLIIRPRGLFGLVDPKSKL